MSRRQYHKMEKPKYKKSLATLSLSSCELEWMSVCLNEGGNVLIYTHQVSDLITWLGQNLTLEGSNSPRETPKVHFIILKWGLLPRLTMKVVPQGPYTIITSQKGENTSLMGVQQHTIIIYIRISFKFTNKSTISSGLTLSPIVYYTMYY